MQAINYVRDYTNTGGHAAWLPVRRPPSTDKVRILNNRMVVGDTNPVSLYFSSLVNGAAIAKTRAVRQATIRRLVADGFNGLCLRSTVGSRKWSDSGSNHGLWKYVSTDSEWSTVSNRWLLEESGTPYVGEPTGLVVLDEMIADALKFGMECVYLDLEGWGTVLSRHASQPAPGIYEGRSAPDIVDSFWDIWVEHITRIYTRTSTVPGFGRYCDHPRIIWKFRNEVGITNAYCRSDLDRWGDVVLTGNRTSGLPVISGLSSTSLLHVGMTVSGTGIPGTTLIQSIDSSTQVTLDKNATSGSGTSTTLTFYTSLNWYDKFVEGWPDAFGANGAQYSEVTAALEAWRDANDPTWTIPAWGRAGARGLPKRSTWLAHTSTETARDRGNLLQFLCDRCLFAVNREQAWARAQRADVILNTGTWSYSDPRCHIALAPEYQQYSFSETHHYYNDYFQIGPQKDGIGRTRGSIIDFSTDSSAWNGTTSTFARNGASYLDKLGGVSSPNSCHMSTEEGQYGPNRWRWERPWFGMLVACLKGHGVAEFAHGQQTTTDQLITDGRYGGADNHNAGRPTSRLMSRAIAPVMRWPELFLPRATSTYTVNVTNAHRKTRQLANNGGDLSAYDAQEPGYSAISSGGQHGTWVDTRVLLTIDDGVALTSAADMTANYPKKTTGNMTTGFFIRNTADNLVYLKANYGTQLATPYMEGYGGTITETPVAGSTRTMTLKAESMTATVTCAVYFIRSEGPWPLYTGAWRLFILGSDYSLKFVNRGSDFTDGGPDAPGEAAFMDTDGVVIYYSAANNEDFGAGTSSDSRLMMPEAFTVAITGPEQEIYAVSAAGVPTKVATTYSSGATRFAYTPSLGPEYLGFPKSQLPRVASAPRRALLSR